MDQLQATVDSGGPGPSWLRRDSLFPDDAAPDMLLNRVISQLDIECQRLTTEKGHLKFGPGSEYTYLPREFFPAHSQTFQQPQRGDMLQL